MQRMWKCCLTHGREANSRTSRARARAWAEETENENATRLWRETNLERERMHCQANLQKTKNKNNAVHGQSKQRTCNEKACILRKSKPRTTLVNVRARRARKAHAVPQQWKRTPCPDHLCYWCGTTLTPNIHTHRPHHAHIVRRPRHTRQHRQHMR